MSARARPLLAAPSSARRGATHQHESTRSRASSPALSGSPRVGLASARSAASSGESACSGDFFRPPPAIDVGAAAAVGAASASTPSSPRASAAPELVLALKTLILRESWEADSTMCEARLVQAGWVLRVLERRKLGDGGGERVRIAIAHSATDQMEKVLGAEVISPRGHRKVEGWVDAAATDGSPHLKPYVKPPEVVDSPRRSPRRQRARSPRSPRQTAAQVHASSGLPLSSTREPLAQHNSARVGADAAASTRAAAGQSAADGKGAGEAGGGEGKGASDDVAGSTRGLRRQSTVAMSGAAVGGASAGGLSTAAKKSASNMWAAFTETLFKGDEAEDQAKLRSVFNSIDLDGGTSIYRGAQDDRRPALLYRCTLPTTQPFAPSLTMHGLSRLPPQAAPLTRASSSKPSRRRGASIPTPRSRR